MLLSPNKHERCCTSCLGHCSFSATASTEFATDVMQRKSASCNRLRSSPVWYTASYNRVLSIGVSFELVEAIDKVAGQCKRHKCGREGHSLLFAQRPPSTHWSRRAPCHMRLSDSSLEPPCMQRFRTFAEGAHQLPTIRQPPDEEWIKKSIV